MAKRKKLTEKEWKRQLEEKAAFEASEKVAKKAAIYSALRSAQIGAKIVEKSTPDFPEIIVEIDREDCNDEPEYFCFRTNCGNCYEGFDFLNDEQTGEPSSVIFCPEIEQEEEQDSDQLTFDDLAAMISENETAEPSTVSPSAAKSVTIGGKVSASPDLGTSCAMSAPVQSAPSRSKTARRRLWWAWAFRRMALKNCAVAWWWLCGGVTVRKTAPWRGVGRRGAVRAAPT